MNTNIERDNGATFGFDWKTGVWRFDVPYVVDSVASLVTFVPDFLPLGLPVTNRRGGERKDGSWDLILTHEGQPSQSGYSGNNDTAELDYQTAEDPIETFDKFDELAKKYKARFAADNPDRLESWPKTIALDGGSKQKNPLYGVTHFLNPSPIWRVTLTRQSLPGSLLSGLGRIGSPMSAGGQNAPVSAPELPNGGNWMKRSVRASYRGNVWVIVIEHLGSGDGGFVKDIYGSTDPQGDSGVL